MNHCLHCKKDYAPDFSTKAEAMKLGNAVQREQWISGICSQKCWDELFGFIEEIENETAKENV